MLGVSCPLATPPKHNTTTTARKQRVTVFRISGVICIAGPGLTQFSAAVEKPECWEQAPFQAAQLTQTGLTNRGLWRPPARRLPLRPPARSTRISSIPLHYWRRPRARHWSEKSWCSPFLRDRKLSLEFRICPPLDSAATR